MIYINDKAAMWHTKRRKTKRFRELFQGHRGVQRVNGGVIGGTVFGDVYADSTSVTLKAVPDSDYAFSKWQKWNGSGWEDISGTTASTNTFNVTADVNIKAVFQTPNALVTIQKNGVIWTDSGHTLKLRSGLPGSYIYTDMADTSTGIYTAVVGGNDNTLAAMGSLSVGDKGPTSSSQRMQTFLHIILDTTSKRFRYFCISHGFNIGNSSPHQPAVGANSVSITDISSAMHSSSTSAQTASNTNLQFALPAALKLAVKIV
ncbi:MAG: hypothetical protein VB071_12165 [Lawsonibacter sp.]|nr:hypothetical protein [Lawsonibacter sp.]